MGRVGAMGGGLVSVAAKSKARGVGVGERGDRSEGGGDGESMAIKEDGCAVNTRSRALGLEVRTDSGGTSLLDLLPPPSLVCRK